MEMKLLDLSISVVENIDEMQFLPENGTLNAIFITRLLQGKYIAAKKLLYLEFLVLKKAMVESHGSTQASHKKFSNGEEGCACSSEIKQEHQKSRVNGQYCNGSTLGLMATRDQFSAPNLFILEALVTQVFELGHALVVGLDNEKTVHFCIEA